MMYETRSHLDIHNLQPTYWKFCVKPGNNFDAFIQRRDFFYTLTPFMFQKIPKIITELGMASDIAAVVNPGRSGLRE